MSHHSSCCGVDGNGVPFEVRTYDGVEVRVHHDDIPESDVTTVHGLRVTTPLRTVIDVAPDITTGELDRVVEDCLRRRLFTVEDALDRVDRPDMLLRRGAHLLRARLMR
jgi:hypothetical protein